MLVHTAAAKVWVSDDLTSNCTSKSTCLSGRIVMLRSLQHMILYYSPPFADILPLPAAARLVHISPCR
jgi:hypothetical protein